MTNYRAEEYYDYQQIKEKLYSDSLQGEEFYDLLSIILQEDNLRMSYRKIKANKGSQTKGSDEYTIENVKITTLEEYLRWMKIWLLDYTPKPIRRKYIPKANGEQRPLGIPCIRDRLLQQTVLQILEPIAEAKMSDHSFGFRKGRSVQDAVEYSRNLVRLGNYFAVEFDLRKCFDNIPHNRLLDVLWKNGIRDKRLLMVIKKMLKAPIKEDDKLIKSDIGATQGGILSPLLMNIYLNELDKWVDTQYSKNPSLGLKDKGWVKRARKSGLKRGIIVRYADDFIIFTNNLEDAEAWLFAIREWIKNNLQLEINEEKTHIVDLRKKSITFLGYKIKGNQLGAIVGSKNKKGLKDKQYCYTSSGLGDKLIEKMVATIRLLLKLILKESNPKRKGQLVYKLNATILGYQNFAQHSTQCASNLWNVYQRVKAIWYKTKYAKGDVTTHFTDTFKMLYPECERFTPVFSTQKVTIFPIWKVAYKKHSFQLNHYLDAGENSLDRLVVAEIHKLLRRPIPNASMEYNDLRISKYSAQKGRDYVTGNFLPSHNVHCHHVQPKFLGGKDKFNNLVILSPENHKLVHRASIKVPEYYTNKMIAKLNKLRYCVGNSTISPK